MGEVTHTERGFAPSEFNDIYGAPCKLQASSLAEIDAIWFGTKGNEMHLSRTLFEDLLPHIREMLGLRGENKAGGLWYRRWHEACERERVAAEALATAQAEIEALRNQAHDLVKEAFAAGAQMVYAEWKDVCECCPDPRHADIPEAAHQYWRGLPARAALAGEQP